MSMTAVFEPLIIHSPLEAMKCDPKISMQTSIMTEQSPFPYVFSTVKQRTVLIQPPITKWTFKYWSIINELVQPIIKELSSCRDGGRLKDLIKLELFVFDSEKQTILETGLEDTGCVEEIPRRLLTLAQKAYVDRPQSQVRNIMVLVHYHLCS